MIRHAVCITVGSAAGVVGATVTGWVVRWRRARDRRWTAYTDAVAAEIQAAADRDLIVT